MGMEQPGRGEGKGTRGQERSAVIARLGNRVGASCTTSHLGGSAAGCDPGAAARLCAARLLLARLLPTVFPQ